MACSSTISYVTKRQFDDRLSLSKLYIRDKLDTAKSFYKKDLFAHYGCVNAIEFSNEGQLLVSGGDDRRVLVWRVEEAIHGHYKPTAMRAQHISNIFCLGYDSTNSKIFSAGNDDQVIVHDTRTGDPTDYFLHEQPVYGLSIDPLNDHVFASACDDGRILIYDIRVPGTNESFCLASYPSAFHGVMFNPVEPRLVATANSKEGVSLWDIRKPRQELIRYGSNTAPQSCMSVKFNQQGTHVLALRRRLPPVLYHTQSAKPCAQFDHPGYYNSCTMKSCSFAGDRDQYILSGSDDFNLYMWKIPSLQKSGQWVSSAHMILKGHRSIVNQVRFNPANCIIASSGVEKIVKFWSPLYLPGSTNDECETTEETADSRKVFTHEEYITLVLQSGQFMSHDYSHQSTLEDPRMMAFFDSLVQREIEGWSSEDSVHSTVSLQLAGEAPEPTVQSSATNSDSDSGPDDHDAASAFVQALQAKHNKDKRKRKRNDDATTEASGSSNSETNRITQLIAQKRDQLMRLAHAKVKADRKTSKRSQKLKLSRFVDSSTSSSSSDSSSSSSSSSTSTEDWSYQPGTAHTSFKNSKGAVVTNGVKRLAPASSSSDTDDSFIPTQRNRKRLKVKRTSSSVPSTNGSPVKINESNNITSEQLSSQSTPVPKHNNAFKSTSFSSTDESSLEEWNKSKLNSRSKKCSATPDSGIELSRANGSMSQSNEESEKLPKFSKGSKNRLKRSYRNRVATTDSDSD